MKPRIRLATAQTPDGGEMVLYQHDQAFFITVNGQELMHSRQNESERELARLGCAHLLGHKEPCVLIGGLGMGYTLSETLDLLGPRARVVMGELLGAVIQWNREFFGELNGHPLKDQRVDLQKGDIVKLISRSKNKYDAILLDIDNGPSALTDSGNRRLYGRQGIRACRHALRKQGCLAVWSVEPSKKFEELLMECELHVRRYRAASYKGSKSQCRFVWVASEDPSRLPPGGGEPRMQPANESGGNRKGRTPGRAGRGRHRR